MHALTYAQMAAGDDQAAHQVKVALPPVPPQVVLPYRQRKLPDVVLRHMHLHRCHHHLPASRQGVRGHGIGWGIWLRVYGTMAVIHVALRGGGNGGRRSRSRGSHGERG